MINLIDTHCHLNFKAFVGQEDEAIRRAREAGVTLIINVGAAVATSRKALDLAEKYDDLYAAVSIHPIHANDKGESVEGVAAMLPHPKIVAIGETGLDFYRVEKRDSGKPAKLSAETQADRQEEFFRGFIGLAKKHNLPLILHARESYDEIVAILSEYDGLKGVIHCFSGTKAQAQKFLDLGLHISFTGIITYKNADDLREVVKMIPIERIMVETDAPYLSPEPMRGQQNEPAYVIHTAKKLAEIKGLSFEEVAEATTKTAKRLFGV